MSVELKPGYWKTRDGTIAFVMGKDPFFPDREYPWLGTMNNANANESWTNSGRAYSDDEENDGDLVMYIGQTLPLDPGEGWRLLEEGETVANGDEFYTPQESWKPHEYLVGKTKGRGILPTRRRIVPESQKPPDVWKPTGRFLAPVNLTANECSSVTMNLTVRPSHREITNGTETKWEPVEIGT